MRADKNRIPEGAESRIKTRPKKPHEKQTHGEGKTVSFELLEDLFFLVGMNVKHRSI